MTVDAAPRSLYPYQKVGAEFLASRRRALLADRMGLGKTIQAIEAAKRINAPSTLVVSPASVVSNWAREWEAWGGPPNATFTSYTKLARGFASTGSPSLVILDEAHYCKNPYAKRTKAALRAARRAGYAWLLTGTPMPNDPTEIFAWFKYLWPEKLEEIGVGSAEAWMHRFCFVRYTEYGPKPYAVRNGSELRRHIESIMLRRSLEDAGLELPPLRVDVQTFPKKQLDGDIYSDEVEGDEYTSRVRRVLGEAKAGFVADTIIDELTRREYREVVVLFYHTSVGGALRTAFKAAGLSVVGFDGSTPQEKRSEAIRAFQLGRASVFLAQQTAAGVGITLTRANEIVLVEPAWSPDDNLQAITRIHRIGQDHPCRARIFAASGTVDEAIMGTLRTKMQMKNEILGG